ncbi:unnamed protein product, partial [Urochloa humidicola]
VLSSFRTLLAPGRLHMLARSLSLLGETLTSISLSSGLPTLDP